MAKKQKLSTYILLDRSGSMAGPKWEKSIGGINEYVSTLKIEGIEGSISVIAFDSGYGNSKPNEDRSDRVRFTPLRTDVEITNFEYISHQEVSPAGGTPLYDATARVLNMADKNNNEKTVIVIVTDGEENESVIYNLTSIKDRIDTCRYRGWEVIFLGAEFNVENTAMKYGLATTKTVNSSADNLGFAFRGLAASAASYTVCNDAIDTTIIKNIVEQHK